MVKRMVGGLSLTGNGFRDWLVQRFSSLIIAAYFICVLVFFLSYPRMNYLFFQHFFNSIEMKIFTLITLFSIILHAWIGMWTVLTDYVKQITLRLLLEFATILVLLSYFFWGVVILFRFNGAV